jgi:hypothetical protein
VDGGRHLKEYDGRGPHPDQGPARAVHSRDHS